MFSLIEKLQKLFDEYGEEEVLLSLAALLDREVVNDDDVDNVILCSERSQDIKSLVKDKWGFE